MLKDNTLEKMVNAFNRNYDFLYKEEERNDRMNNDGKEK